MDRLKGKVALVTGAGNGQGAAEAKLGHERSVGWAAHGQRVLVDGRWLYEPGADHWERLPVAAGNQAVGDTVAPRWGRGEVAQGKLLRGSCAPPIPFGTIWRSQRRIVFFILQRAIIGAGPPDRRGMVDEDAAECSGRLDEMGQMRAAA